MVATTRAALAPKLLPGMSYLRAGILCLDLAPDGAVPVLPGVLKQSALIGKLIDAVNAHFGTDPSPGPARHPLPRPLGQPPSRLLPALHHRLGRAVHRPLRNSH
jgi:hypothetical protein